MALGAQHMAYVFLGVILALLHDRATGALHSMAEPVATDPIEHRR